MEDLYVKRGYTLYFILILIVMFCGAISKYLTIISLICSAVLAIAIANTFIKKKSVDICNGIIILLMFQNLALGLGAHLGQNMDSSLKLITQVPFLTISIIFLYTITNDIKNKRYDKSMKYFFVLILCVVLSIAIGRGSIQAILVNIRNLTVFYMAFLIGKMGIKDNNDLKEFIILVIRLAIIILIAGIFLLYTGYDGYKIIGIKEVYVAKGVPQIQEGLDGRFRTTLISKQYDRMGSILYEPINLAYFYAAASLLCIFSKWTNDIRKKNICSIICIIGLILTFGKGGYMILAVEVGAYLYRAFLVNIFRKINEKFIYKFSLIGIIVVVVALCMFYIKNIGAAVMPHIWGIQRTWVSVLKKPYGHGLGTGGNAAESFNNNNEVSWLDSGGETALMSFMYQIGVQGVLAMILVLINMTSFTKKRKAKSKIDGLTIVFNYIPIVLLGVSLLQDNTFTPQCVVIYMMVLGALKNINKVEYDEKIRTED